MALLLAANGVSAQGPVIAFQAADARGQAFDLGALRGNVVAVTFVSRYTQDEAARVNDALGRHGDVKVVSVVDFMGIPGFVHGYARRKMAEADGRVRHLCDERGQLRKQFGAHPDKHVDIFIIDRDGGLRGRFEGQQQLDGALRLLDEVRGATEARAGSDGS
ncbi:MAG: hypothetical protein JWM53_6274 [bacterium]|nr:hypothetical protein [bacterium]